MQMQLSIGTNPQQSHDSNGVVILSTNLTDHFDRYKKAVISQNLSQY